MKQNNKLLLRFGSAMLLALSAALTARADYPSTICLKARRLIFG